MRWAVTGRGGQLGSCLSRVLSGSGDHQLVSAWDRAALDIADAAAVETMFDDVPGGAPDVLVNAAAFTAVDRCESEEALAMRVNAEAPGLLANRCAQSGVRFVHISTDYVFDGEATSPYRESAPTGPRTAYGRSKLAGEERVRAAMPDAIVIRTSWVYGPGRNFVAAILNQAALRRSGEVEGPLRVVDDQFGSPTHAGDLAQCIVELIELPVIETGLFHFSNAGVISWWDFARAILDATGHADLEIDRIGSDTLDLPAARPLYSVLDCSRLERLGLSRRPWRDGLADHLGLADDAPLRTAGSGAPLKEATQ